MTKHKLLRFSWIALIPIAIIVLHLRGGTKGYYACIDGVQGSTRCAIIGGPANAKGGCYGAYPLKTTEITDGIIIPDTPAPATCEELTVSTKFYFDKKGRYIQTRYLDAPESLGQN